eukprot:TRINITY_DN10181_c0_g1_i2.p1 TRINITY_DN10181_c0_g1~~TRINITY_DN10181_c0_g1_i2.p1  ORF type:complete len:369 (-),score=103.35 TRINITY_DN10181_c0_g1_i2:116-1222(-)
MNNNIKSSTTQCRHFEKSKLDQWGMISLAQDLEEKKEEEERLLKMSERKKAYSEIIKQQIQEKIERERDDRNRKKKEGQEWIVKDQSYVSKLKELQERKKRQRIEQEKRDQQNTDHSLEKAHLRRFEKEIENKEMAQFVQNEQKEDQKLRLRRFQANRHVQDHNFLKILMKRPSKDIPDANSSEDISVALAVEGEKRKIKFQKKMESMERKTQTIMEKYKRKSFMELQQESARRAELERRKIENSINIEINELQQKQEEKRKNYLEGLKKFEQEQKAIKKEIKSQYESHCQKVREEAESYIKEIDHKKKLKKNETNKYSAYLQDQMKERLVREEKSINELSQIEVDINKPVLEKLGLTEQLDLSLIHI